MAKGEDDMTTEDLEALFDYGYWANKKLFAVISQLTPEEFTKTVAGSYGSVRNTMVHVLSAEAGWLDRCGGAKRGPRLKPDDFPTAASVIQAWDKVEQQMREFLADLQDEDVDRDVVFVIGASEPRSLPIGKLLQHAANHGVHHRAQVAMLLRMLDHVPGNFDMIFYFEDKSE
jgi:uncharacterized damage-inducible protein DinB